MTTFCLAQVNSPEPVSPVVHIISSTLHPVWTEKNDLPVLFRSSWVQAFKPPSLTCAWILKSVRLQHSQGGCCRHPFVVADLRMKQSFCFYSKAVDEFPRKLWMLRFNINSPYCLRFQFNLPAEGSQGEWEQVTVAPSSGYRAALQALLCAAQSSLLKGCVDPGFTQDKPDTTAPLWWSSGRLYRNQSKLAVA